MGQSGFFIIRPYDEKTTLALKGNFDRTNTLWIKKAMLASKSIHKNTIELDMREVDTIDMAAMALITIALKTLRESGIATRVTGLDEKKRMLAHSLGMHYITQIH
jgi:anti-anti-sigma regulatory factor